MGLAASQARTLLLVARKSDLEYRSQCLTQRKMVLAMQTEQLAREYSTKISNRRLQFVHNLSGSSAQTSKEDLTYYSLLSNSDMIGNYRVLDTQGNIVVPSAQYIPYTTQQIPKYTLVEETTTEGVTTQTPYAKTNDNYTAVSTDEIGQYTGEGDNKAYTELYIKSIDNNNEVEYIKIQDAKTGIVEDAKYKTTKDGAYINIFKDGQLIEDLKGKLTVYQKVPTPSYDTTTDATKAGQTVNIDGKTYVYRQLDGQTQTVDVPRQPASDGYYYSDDGKRYIIAPEIGYVNYFQNGLRNGALYLEQESKIDELDQLGNKTGRQRITWNAATWQGLATVQDNLYTEDDAVAESEYEAKTALLKAQDQMLDMEIKQIETQHKAVETEWDSVKKIIDGNIEKTFKIFA